MALGIRASNTGSTSGGTSITVTKPSGTTSGDYLLGLISKDDDDAPVFTGFTDIAGAGGGTTTSEGRASYKVAGGSEGASYTINWSGGEDGVAMVLAIQDTTGIDVVAEDVSTANRTSGSVSATVTSNGSLAILYAACEDAGSNFTAPDGTWTQRGSTLTQGSGVTGASMAVWSKSVDSGSTGTLTVGSDANQELIVGLIVFAPSSGGAYTLDAAKGTFTLAGTATGLKASRKLAAATQTYALTGTATGLRASRKLAATTATYTLSGIATPLQAARKLPVTTATFTLTGVAAGLSRAYPFVAGTGTFTLTGIDTVLQAARKIAAATATYTLNGVNSGVTVQRKIAGGTGIFALTGVDTAIAAQRAIAAGTGDFAITGIDTELTYTPAAGSYALDAGTGAFALAGNDAGLEYTSSNESRRPPVYWGAGNRSNPDTTHTPYVPGPLYYAELERLAKEREAQNQPVTVEEPALPLPLTIPTKKAKSVTSERDDEEALIMMLLAA